MKPLLTIVAAVIAIVVLALSALKLAGVIDWPWLAITALLWAPLGVAAVVAFVLLLLLLWALRGTGGVP